MTLGIVAVVERWYGGGLMHLPLIGSIDGRRGTVVAGVVHGHGRILSRGWRWHGLPTRLHECLHRSFLLFLGHILKVLHLLVSHGFVRGSRRGCSIDSSEITTLFFLGNLMNEFIHRLILLSVTPITAVLLITTKKWQVGNLEHQITLNHTCRVRGRSRGSIIKLQCSTNKHNRRNDTQQSKVWDNIFLGLHQNSTKDKGTSNPQLVTVQRYTSGHGTFILWKPRRRQ
mmetsp:Transcript_28863/g.46800  ORF Transcript_28863/g.46800 Transcript_28863/m.46800 type:complete len:228 (+) Transcript_28863:973-1656(+)